MAAVGLKVLAALLPFETWEGYRTALKGLCRSRIDELVVDSLVTGGRTFVRTKVGVVVMSRTRYSVLSLGKYCTVQ